jgi:hypothetical protein
VRSMPRAEGRSAMPGANALRRDLQVRRCGNRAPTCASTAGPPLPAPALGAKCHAPASPIPIPEPLNPR